MTTVVARGAGSKPRGTVAVEGDRLTSGPPHRVDEHETPFAVSVGSGTMVSDGVSFVNADYSSTSFRIDEVLIGTSNFFGNGVVYPAGGRTGDNVLFGTKTMVPVTLGVGAVVHYGATMHDDVVLEADSFLMKGTEVPERGRFGGNPAQELRPTPARLAV